MSWRRGALERARETFARPRVESEFDEEIRFHLEQEVERLTADGMNPESARREAHRRFGTLRRVREEVREGWGFQWLECTARDLRYAVRGLRRDRGFAIAAVLTLGLGIGVTTAVFSVVKGVVVESLPYPDSDRLVRFVQQSGPSNRWNLSVVDFEAVEEYEQVFEVVAALRTAPATLTGRGRPERISAGWVTADWFRVLGVPPAEGRDFLEGEDQPGAVPVVVLSAAFRDRMFGAGVDALGASLTLDGQAYTVVGVLPSGRESLAGHEADVWPILQLATPTRRGPFYLRGYGRLDSGHTLQDARSDLSAISERIFPQWAGGFSDRAARLTPYPLKAMLVGDVGGTLWMLLGAVVGVLLISIANVINLVLVRATAREREMALRASLGATRPRLARQLIVESLLLAALGGLLGLAFATVGLRTLVATSPLPRLESVSLDLGVLGFAGALSVLAGLLFGLAPLLHGVGGGRRGGRGHIRSALVAAEFAIALPLLAEAGLLLGSFLRLQSVDPGYEPENLISASVALPPADYPGFASAGAFWLEALRRLEELPAVSAVGVSTGLPPDFAGNTNNFDLLDKPVGEGESEHVSVWAWSSPGFLVALGVPLLEGRMPGPQDDGMGPPIVVVSRSWAERYYPGEDVLGKQLYAGGDRSVAMTVVGVVADVKYQGLDATDDAAVYEPYAQAAWSVVNLLVRARGSVASVRGAVEKEIASLDPDIPLANVETMTARLSSSVAGPRYWTSLLGAFAGLGIVLAAIGVYGVLSYHVSRQRREIGIRIALGARPASVRRLIVRRGMSRAALGIGIGVVASLFLTRLTRSLLFQVSSTDPGTLASVAAVLALVALLACWFPARRATRIDPIRTLRVE